MRICRWIGVLLFLFCFSSSFSQSIADMKKKQEKTEKEIAYLNRLLKEARKDKSATVQKLNIINEKISKGKEMLNSLNEEVSFLEGLIADNEAVKSRLEGDRQRMLDFYSKMVYLMVLEHLYGQMVTVLMVNLRMEKLQVLEK